MNTLRYGGYPRISEDPKDLRRGTKRQREDIQDSIVRQGIPEDSIVWYDENDTSAYKKRRVQKVDGLGNPYIGYRVIRPKWQQALADLRSGVIDVLRVYDLDRLARDPRDLEDAIEVVQYYGKRIESVVPGQIDLMSDAGIANARVIMAMNSKSSADTARRVARAHLDFAKDGKPVGGDRPFGWLDDKATLHPVESAAMTEVINKVIAGASIRSVVAELNEKELLTTRGNEWSSQGLTQYLRNPRLVGVRLHKGQEIRDKEGNLVRGQWDAMLDQDTWDRLVVAMKRSKRAGVKVGRANARQHLLTGVLRCSICNRAMYGDRNVKNGRPHPRYHCTQAADHSNSIKGEPVEQIVHRLVTEKLAQDAIDAPPPPTWDGAAKIAELEATIAATLAQLGTGKIKPERIFASVETLEEQVAELNVERNQWIEDTVGPAVKKTTPAEYLSEGTDVQRGVIEKYFSAIYVTPQVKPKKIFDPDRVLPAWRAAD